MMRLSSGAGAASAAPSPSRQADESVARSLPQEGMPARLQSLNGVAIALVLAGVGYNTLLAFLNARGIYVGLPLVIITEIMVLGLAGLVMLRTGFRHSDTPALLLFFFFLVDGLIVSLVAGEVFADMARNAAIIALFLMIGTRVEEATVKRTFAIVAIFVFAILLLEILSVTSFAALLEPGLYFEQTRGIDRFELDEIGLFANAVGFADRFAILNLVAHRTASLFLEQVSLANFATVLTIFLVSMWRRISWRARLAYSFLIALILVTNNSRTALGITLIAPLVYLIAPKLPRLISLALMPVLLASAWLVTNYAPPSAEDNLVGRLSLTVRTLREMNMTSLLGGDAMAAAGFADSGYTFVIYASSIIGLVVLWFFFCLILSQTSATHKRANFALALYLFLNLTVSGTSVFSIKTAALLWFLVGFLRSEPKPGEEPHLTPEPLGENQLSARRAAYRVV